MRSPTLSAVLLLAATAAAQQLKPKAEPPAKGTVAEAILTAHLTHPDIKLAEAKVRMAEAELAQAKLLVAQRLTMAISKLEQAKMELGYDEGRFEMIARQAERALVGQMEVLTARDKLKKSKAAVAAAEVELNAAKGTVPGVTDTKTANQVAVEAGLRWLDRQQGAEGVGSKPLPGGAVADKLRTMIDKPVTLDLKGADIDEAFAAMLKAAGEPELTVKSPMLGKKYLKQPPTVTFTGNVTFTAAVQVVMDDINNPTNGGRTESLMGKYDVYVREYGLLVARAEDAPKDALTLTEFARQVRAEKK